MTRLPFHVWVPFSFLLMACGSSSSGGGDSTPAGGAGGTGGGAVGGAAQGGAAQGGAVQGGAAQGGAAQGGGGGVVAGAVGDVCSNAETCPAGGSGQPVCIADWPDGYCAVDGCADHGHDCPDDPGQGGKATSGSQCVLAPTPKCLALCADNEDCREGYTCTPKPDGAGHGEANVCFPDGG